MFPNQTSSSTVSLPHPLHIPLTSLNQSLCWQNSLILCLHSSPLFLLSVIHLTACRILYLQLCTCLIFSFLEWYFLKIAKACNIASYYIYRGFTSCSCIWFIARQNILNNGGRSSPPGSVLQFPLRKVRSKVSVRCVPFVSQTRVAFEIDGEPKWPV